MANLDVFTDMMLTSDVTSDFLKTMVNGKDGMHLDLGYFGTRQQGLIAFVMPAFMAYSLVYRFKSIVQIPLLASN